MQKIAVFGMPTAAAAAAPGVERAPFVLRGHGLLKALSADGTPVVNLSDLSLFVHREDADHPSARNADVVACAVRTAADEMTRALEEGLTLVLGGDSTIVVGALQGARSLLRVPIALVYVSGSADLLTPETTRTGHLERMSLALALGQGPEAVAKTVFPVAATTARHTVLLGVREWEVSEKAAAESLVLTIPAAAVENRGVMASAASALQALVGPVVIHFGVGVVRAEEMPATRPSVPGGLTLASAAELLRALLASSRVIALVVTGYSPALDGNGQSGRKLVDLIASALTRRGH